MNKDSLIYSSAEDVRERNHPSVKNKIFEDIESSTRHINPDENFHLREARQQESPNTTGSKLRIEEVYYKNEFQTGPIAQNQGAMASGYAQNDRPTPIVSQMIMGSKTCTMQNEKQGQSLEGNLEYTLLANPAQNQVKKSNNRIAGESREEEIQGSIQSGQWTSTNTQHQEVRQTAGQHSNDNRISHNHLPLTQQVNYHIENMASNQITGSSSTQRYDQKQLPPKVPAPQGREMSVPKQVISNSSNQVIGQRNSYQVQANDRQSTAMFGQPMQPGAIMYPTIQRAASNSNLTVVQTQMRNDQQQKQPEVQNITQNTQHTKTTMQAGLNGLMHSASQPVHQVTQNTQASPDTRTNIHQRSSNTAATKQVVNSENSYQNKFNSAETQRAYTGQPIQSVQPTHISFGEIQDRPKPTVSSLKVNQAQETTIVRNESTQQPLTSQIQQNQQSIRTASGVPIVQAQSVITHQNIVQPQGVQIRVSEGSSSRQASQERQIIRRVSPQVVTQVAAPQVVHNSPAVQPLILHQNQPYRSSRGANIQNAVHHEAHVQSRTVLHNIQADAAASNHRVHKIGDQTIIENKPYIYDESGNKIYIDPNNFSQFAKIARKAPATQQVVQLPTVAAPVHSHIPVPVVTTSPAQVHAVPLPVVQKDHSVPRRTDRVQTHPEAKYEHGNQSHRVLPQQAVQRSQTPVNSQSRSHSQRNINLVQEEFTAPVRSHVQQAANPDYYTSGRVEHEHYDMHEESRSRHHSSKKRKHGEKSKKKKHHRSRAREEEEYEKSHYSSRVEESRPKSRIRKVQIDDGAYRASGYEREEYGNDYGRAHKRIDDLVEELKGKSLRRDDQRLYGEHIEKKNFDNYRNGGSRSKHHSYKNDYDYARGGPSPSSKENEYVYFKGGPQNPYFSQPPFPQSKQDQWFTSMVHQPSRGEPEYNNDEFAESRFQKPFRDFNFDSNRRNYADDSSPYHEDMDYMPDSRFGQTNTAIRGSGLQRGPDDDIEAALERIMKKTFS